jgi:hypothetical protein
MLRTGYSLMQFHIPVDLSPHHTHYESQISACYIFSTAVWYWCHLWPFELTNSLTTHIITVFIFELSLTQQLAGHRVKPFYCNIYNCFSGARYELWLGANRIDTSESGSQVVLSEYSIIHDQYDGNTVNNDIAVVWLPSEITFDSEYCNILINIKIIFLTYVPHSMLASGTWVCGFEPGRSHRIFSGVKILSMPSFGREVKPFAPCHRFVARKRTLWLHGSWVTGKICWPFLARFPPSLIEVPTLTQHGAPLELTEETKGRCTEG